MTEDERPDGRRPMRGEPGPGASEPAPARLAAPPAPRSAATPAWRTDDLVVGAFWVILAMISFAVMAALVRHIALAGVHPLVVMLLRTTIGVLLMAPMLIWRGASLFRSDQLHLYGMRVIISFASMTSWIYALALVRIGEVTAIGFLAPLFGTIGAVIFLKEVVGVRRWTALAVGFAGAMIILRPGASEIGNGQLLALFSALCSGMIGILVKRLTYRDDPDRIVFLTNLMMVPLAAVMAAFVWRTPPLETLPYLLALGAVAILGHMALVRGLARIDASLVMTLEFSRLPFAVLLGYVVFGELIDHWTWLGALVIFASGLYITRREAKLRRQRLERERI